jgi:putative ABC transport system permease protein
MYWLLNLWGLIKVAGQRQRSYLGLVLALAAGFIVAVALVVSIPLYADAVGYRILRAELQPDAEGTTRPPFALMFSRSAANNNRIPIDQYEKADRYFVEAAPRDLRLPVDVMVRYATTDKMRLYPAQDNTDATGQELTFVGVGFASGIESKVEITEGALPKPSTEPEGPVEIMVYEGLADQLGVQPGEEYLVLERVAEGVPIRIPVRIAGIWRPINPGDAFWFIRPQSLQDVLLVPEETYKTRILSQGNRALYQALWYLVLDGSEVRSRHVGEMVGRISTTLRRASLLLPDVTLPVSPRNALERQRTQSQLLIISLITFSVPILGLIAYFIIMVSGMVVQRQQNEIAVLRGRGASRSEILGIYLLEGLGLGLIALAIGLFLGRYSAMLMGWTRSFLQFEPRSDVTVQISPESIRGGLLVIALTLIASLLPALGAAGHTIISYKQERARSIRRPLWQRAYLDLLLLIPAYYGYRQLEQRGTISILGRGVPGGDPFQNPLLILTPALWLLALALISARLFPILMGLLGNLLSRLPGVSGMLALRYLTRTPRAYTGPVLLLILTLSLAAFTASMAKTLDSHLDDQVHYDVGGEIRVADLGQNMEGGSGAPGGAPGAEQPAAEEESESQGLNEPKWMFLPVTDYMRIPGVRDATRVTRSTTEAQVADSREQAVVLGIDRVDFPRVAHWREDYASVPLGALMNALGANPNGILASRGYLAQQGLRIGGTINLALVDYGESRTVPFVVVGVLDYFPTLYPEDGPFFVANLDYLFEQQGGEFPYEVWLDTEPDMTKQQLELGVAELGLRSIVSDEARPTLITAQDRPERQGLYGLLSVGFLAAALLTGLGFLFYSVISFQRRFIELGMLRAIGLSARQMGVLLLCEQSLIIGVGIAAGTGLGIGVSRYFIPFLQVRSGQHPQTPPFQVLIAWDQIQLIYLIFAVLLGLALSTVAVLLLRMKIFQAVKLGEAA